MVSRIVDPRFNARLPAYTIVVTAAVLVHCSISARLLVTCNLGDKKPKRNTVGNWFFHKILRRVTLTYLSVRQAVDLLPDDPTDKPRNLLITVFLGQWLHALRDASYSSIVVYYPSGVTLGSLSIPLIVSYTGTGDKSTLSPYMGESLFGLEFYRILPEPFVVWLDLLYADALVMISYFGSDLICSRFWNTLLWIYLVIFAICIPTPGSRACLFTTGDGETFRRRRHHHHKWSRLQNELLERSLRRETFKMEDAIGACVRTRQ